MSDGNFETPGPAEEGNTSIDVGSPTMFLLENGISDSERFNQKLKPGIYLSQMSDQQGQNTLQGNLDPINLFSAVATTSQTPVSIHGHTQITTSANDSSHSARNLVTPTPSIKLDSRSNDESGVVGHWPFASDVISGSTSTAVEAEPSEDQENSQLDGLFCGSYNDLPRLDWSSDYDVFDFLPLEPSANSSSSQSTLGEPQPSSVCTFDYDSETLTGFDFDTSILDTIASTIGTANHSLVENCPQSIPAAATISQIDPMAPAAPVEIVQMTLDDAQVPVLVHPPLVQPLRPLQQSRNSANDVITGLSAPTISHDSSSSGTGQAPTSKDCNVQAKAGSSSADQSLQTSQLTPTYQVAQSPQPAAQGVQIAQNLRARGPRRAQNPTRPLVALQMGARANALTPIPPSDHAKKLQPVMPNGQPLFSFSSSTLKNQPPRTENLISISHHSMRTTQRTSQLTTARADLQSPVFPVSGGVSLLNSTPTAIAPTRVNPQSLNDHNDLAYLKHYIKKKSLELEEQKMINQGLLAQVQELTANDSAREKQILILVDLISKLAPPKMVEAVVGSLSVVGTSSAGPRQNCSQPGTGTSAPLELQPVVPASSRFLPPPRIPNGSPVSKGQVQQETHYVYRPCGSQRHFSNVAQQHGMMLMPPPPPSGGSSEAQQIYGPQPYPQTNGFDQLSSSGREEHYLGTLQRQHVGQVQLHGNLPQKPQNKTNSDHYHQGNGTTAYSRDSSKRRRNETGDQGNKQQRAGGDGSPHKRRRNYNPEGERTVEEAAIAARQGCSPPKRKQEHSGAQERVSNEGGESGIAQGYLVNKLRSKGGLPTIISEPLTYVQAQRLVLSDRYCDWGNNCGYPVEPKIGAYWEHVLLVHKPKATDENGNIECKVNDCGRAFSPENMKLHLEWRCHLNGKWIKCLECEKELKAKELRKGSLHSSECRENGGKFAVVERVGPILKLKEGASLDPGGLSEIQKESRKMTAEALRKKQERYQNKVE